MRRYIYWEICSVDWDYDNNPDAIRFYRIEVAA
jgi:hypothetical protein